MSDRSGVSVQRAPPSGLLRLLFRLPRLLYRLHLGWLLGRRFLLLRHRGRRSGRLYETVVEVIRYDPETHESIVAAGWGEKSDWYQNIKANPAVEVQTGRERYRPRQRFLSPDEVEAEVLEYTRRHSVVAPLLARMLGFELDGSEEKRRAFAASLRMVAFRPLP